MLRIGTLLLASLVLADAQSGYLGNSRESQYPSYSSSSFSASSSSTLGSPLQTYASLRPTSTLSTYTTINPPSASTYTRPAATTATPVVKPAVTTYTRPAASTATPVVKPAVTTAIRYASTPAIAATTRIASDFPTFAEVQTALQDIVKEGDGFGLEMWATIVDRDGLVKMVVKSGEDRGDQWPGSRVISAQKANTANAFSLPGLALSTANLYAATQPGGSLYGLQHSNPVDTSVAYGGQASAFGTAADPMVGKRIGGVNVFGGGLPLYNADGELIGGIGLSGDSSVADHIKAWKLRDALKLDHVPGGVSPTGDDNMVLDMVDGASTGGWGHPGTTEKDGATVDDLVTAYPIDK